MAIPCRPGAFLCFERNRLTGVPFAFVKQQLTVSESIIVGVACSLTHRNRL